MAEKWDFIGRALEAIEQARHECKTDQDRIKCDDATNFIKERDVIQLLKEGKLYSLIQPLVKLEYLGSIKDLVTEFDEKLPQVQKNYHELTDDKDSKLVWEESYCWLDTLEGRKGRYCPKCFSADFVVECKFCGFTDKTKNAETGPAEINW